MKTKVLNVQTALTGQGTNYVELLEITHKGKPLKLRIGIRSDACKSQGHARIERFSEDTLEWVRLFSRLPQQMQTDSFLYVDMKVRNEPSQHMAIAAGSLADRTWLLARLVDLLK